MKTEATTSINMSLLAFIFSMPKLLSLGVEVDRCGAANCRLPNEKLPTQMRQGQAQPYLKGTPMMAKTSEKEAGPVPNDGRYRTEI